MTMPAGVNGEHNRRQLLGRHSLQRAATGSLPLVDVAPVPTHVPTHVPERSGRGQAVAPPPGVAASEVAATAVLAPPQPLVLQRRREARSRRRDPIGARISRWPAKTVVILAAVMVLLGGIGAIFLAGRLGSLSDPHVAVEVPGSLVTIDTPDGWTEGPVESAPALVESLVAGESVRRPAGLYLTAPGGRALFVVHTPNSAELTAIPEVPARIGAAVILSQEAATHPLGPARRVEARGADGSDAFEIRATYVLVGGQVFVVGVFAVDTLSAADLADYEAVLLSMH